MYERIQENANVKEIHYLSSPDGLFAIYTRENETDANLFYILKDHLGSVHCLLDEEGVLLEELSFDAWGNRRNPETWEPYTATPEFSFDRGFTGHEHLDLFALINMNGRVYDPVICRFLSPDAFVQAPESLQNFNRYSYVLNNPLKYTDPDGEWMHLVIGAVIGGTINWAANGTEFTWKGLGYFGIGAAAGALGAGVGAGVSSALAGGSFGAGFVGSTTAIAASSSFVSGAAIGGGAGFSSGFTTGFGNALIGGKKINEALSIGLNTGLVGAGIGALSAGTAGGIEAVKENRNFWNGQKVNIGRNPFSLNNSPRPTKYLYYVSENRELIRYNHFHSEAVRRKGRFWENPSVSSNDGTFSRFDHSIGLEGFEAYPPSTTINVPTRENMKGFAGITYDGYYITGKSVSFTSNNGLNQTITSGPGTITFKSKNLRTIIGTIFGQGFNDGVVYAPFSFKVLVYLKPF